MREGRTAGPGKKMCTGMRKQHRKGKEGKHAKKSDRACLWRDHGGRQASGGEKGESAERE